MTVQTRSVKSMAELVAAAKKAPTVEAGVTTVLQGVANQLLTAVWAEWEGDKLALPNFSAGLNASVGALTAAILEDVEPTQAQVAVASQELSVAKAEIHAQAQNKAQEKAPQTITPSPAQNQAEAAASAASLSQRQAQARAKGWAVPTQ
jgi:hypothetical protein